MVTKYTGHPLFVDFLAQLIEAYEVPPRDPVFLAAAIRDYSIRFIRYFRESPERFQSPMRTLVWGLGDCDDKSILVASGTRTFRIPTQLVILELDFRGKRTGHVYPEAWLDDQWVPLESVRACPWGHDPARVAAKKGILVSKKVIGDSPESSSHA